MRLAHMNDDGTTSLLLGEKETAAVIQVLADIPETAPIATDIIDAYAAKIQREGAA